MHNPVNAMDEEVSSPPVPLLCPNPVSEAVGLSVVDVVLQAINLVLESILGRTQDLEEAARTHCSTELTLE